MKLEEYPQNNILESLSKNAGNPVLDSKKESKSKIQETKEETIKGLDENVHTQDDNSSVECIEPVNELDKPKLEEQQSNNFNETIESKRTYFKNWVENIKKLNEIGSGAEKQVFVHPEDSNKAVAIFFQDRSVLEIKERFYVNKILHMLYPNIIPDIHLASTSPSVLIIDHVMGKHLKESNLIHKFFRSSIKRRFEKIGVSIDNGIENNFMIDKAGKIFYVDGFLTFGFKYYEYGDDSSIIRLLKEINKLEPESRSVALNYFKRIQYLNNQSLEK